MRIASKVLVFFCLPFHVLGYQVHFVPDNDIYNDLVAMNTTCFPEDMCLGERNDEIPLGRRCSCHAQCAMYDTCCYNSPHRGYGHPLMECTYILDTSISAIGKSSLLLYFLVGKCPSDAPGYSVFKNLCEDPWNREDDMLKIAPVTSLDTRTVYKNIYCFRCHERSDNIRQWYLHVFGVTTDETADSKDYAVSYDQVNGTWVAVSDDKSVSVPVSVYFSPAPEGYSVEYAHRCDADVISDCHDSWTDDYVRDKCRGYHALRYVSRESGYNKYKNPHCAICNYVAPEKICCSYTRPPVIPNTRPPVRPPPRTNLNEDDRGGEGGRVKLFSFRRLIGGMFYGGDNKSEKLQKKCDEYHLWDPYGKRCRKIACALPGYGLRNGRCRRL